MYDVELLLNKMAPEIDPIVEKIGSFRQYCIYSRSYLYSKTLPQHYLMQVVALTYRVIERIGERNSRKYWDECEKIIGPEIDSYTQNKIMKVMRGILN